MHLVAQFAIMTTQSVVVDPPLEEERVMIYDHCNIFPQCVPGDTSARSFER
jgi:hypothetical protein